MVTMADLEAEVAAAFERTASGLSGWPDPHPDRAPFDEEYSRVSDPGKWRIVAARAEAWAEAAVTTGIAALAQDVEVRVVEGAGVEHSRVDRLRPAAPGTTPLVLAYTAAGPDVPAGVTLALGDPTVVVGRAPVCGCDACDSGSRAELEALDEWLRWIVLGRVRHLTDGVRTIVATGNGWSVTGDLGRRDVGDVLADPRGWTEVSGGSWLEPRTSR